MRTEAFASVEDELSEALEALENTNARIQALLESEKGLMGESIAAGETAEAALAEAVPENAVTDAGVAPPEEVS